MTQPTAPSELLREAAKRIREATAAAMGGTPWRAVRSMPFPSISTQRGTEIAAVTYQDRMADAEYIALMHPGVALAVADLLESVAEEWAEMDAHNADPDGMFTPLAADEHMDDALAVARLVLGERSGT